MWTALAIITAGLLAAGGSIAAGYINKQAQVLANSANKEMQESANEANIAEADKNREFQLMMSNTAHQREVEDLKAAGLNPYASVEGPGAAVTGGAMGTSSAARVSAETGVGDGIASAASILQSTAFLAALNAKPGVKTHTPNYH